MTRPKVLYHGSTERVEVLQPHQADDWKFEGGRRFGVYASSNRDVALAFALGAVPDEDGNCIRTMRRADPDYPKMVFVKGHPNFGGKGYLYELPRRGFRPAGADQWVCDHAVRPMEVIEIKVDNHLHLFRYATEEERAAVERELHGDVNRTPAGS